MFHYKTLLGPVMSATKPASILPNTLPRFFLYFVRQQRVWFFLIAILALVWLADQLFWPYMMRRLIDTMMRINLHRDQLWVVIRPIIAISVFVYWMVEIGYRLSGILVAKTFPTMEANIRIQMLDYIQHHSHQYFSDHLAGSLSNQISEMAKSLPAALLQILTIFVPGVVTMLVATFLFSHVSFLFAVILSVWLLAHFSIAIGFAPYCYRRERDHSEHRSTLVGQIVDLLMNMNTVRAFGRENFELHALKPFQDIEKRTNQISMLAMEKVKILLSFFSFAGSLLALNGYALYSWQQGTITLGGFVLIFYGTWNITMIARYMGLQLPTLFKDIGTCRQALTSIQKTHDVVDIKDAQPLIVMAGEIIFKNVHFHYGDYQLFENSTVILKSGYKYGLIGASGSGKTTFVNLILRYFDIKNGAIYIDDQNIAEVTQDSLHANIALIPQDPSLFHRSLLENIRYGKPEASDEEVIFAAKAAHCDEFINLLPKKYHTLVGERGIKLSGGQCQRIAIARAILKNAPILILDEAISALDSVTEELIQESLLSLMHNRTALVIAHRLSTLAIMDELLVFNEGHIAERGTHAELLALGGYYSKLWNAQISGFLLEEE